MPSLEPKKFVTSIPVRSRHCAISRGGSGADPDPITRNDDRSAASINPGASSIPTSSAGGASV